jgi:transcriptional regulator with XRE-family HTH domain
MKTKSLRQIARELGVTHSYLSQVIHNKRPASKEVVSKLLTSGLLKSDDLGYTLNLDGPLAQLAEQMTLNH